MFRVEVQFHQNKDTLLEKKIIEELYTSLKSQRNNYILSYLGSQEKKKERPCFG